MNKVAIYGGLGNQMFQYAFCTALNEKGHKAKISFTEYLYYYHHNGLDLCRSFKIKLPWQSRLLQWFLLNGGLIYQNKPARAILRRLIPAYEKKHYPLYKEKKEFEFDEAVFEQRSVFFTGTWQSLEYFKNIEETLKQKFVFNVPSDAENKSIINKIQNCNAVSIHIRRGDYTNDHWNGILNVIKDEKYYVDAMAYIGQKVGDPRYFVFSDDMQWVKQNLKMDDCTYVDNNKYKSSYVDMYLMSLCKHNIIANSTFSWWGAWLNSHEDKIVIMPHKWMNNSDCRDIFPQQWVKMKV
jgi:hypothetical protein